MPWQMETFQGSTVHGGICKAVYIYILMCYEQSMKREVI